MSVKKKVIIFTSILVTILMTINLVWYMGYWKKYDVCIDNLEKSELEKEDDEDKVSYVGEKYRISVKKPNYLNFKGGFIGVSNVEYYRIRINEDGRETANREYNLNMYIWPDVSGEYEIGIGIMENLGGIDVSYYVNKDLKYIPENEIDKTYNDECQKHIDKYYDELREMLDFAIEYTGLEI